MDKRRLSSALGLVVTLACLFLSTVAIGQVTSGNWAATATAPKTLAVPAVAHTAVSIKNVSAGFAWAILARTTGRPLGHRIDPQSSMTLYGGFTTVVIFYHVPIGSVPNPTNGTWRIVGAPAARAVIEPAGSWYVDSTVSRTASIYVSDATPAPAVTITVDNKTGPAVRLLVKKSTGGFQRVTLGANATVTLPRGMPNWPSGATITEVIVEWSKGAKSTGTYKVTMN